MDETFEWPELLHMTATTCGTLRSHPRSAATPARRFGRGRAPAPRRWHRTGGCHVLVVVCHMGVPDPVLDTAARRQLDLMAHVMFGGLTHAPAIELARRLAGLAPPGLDHVFFADTGSVAVEVASRPGVQYQRNPGPAQPCPLPGPGWWLSRGHVGGDVGLRPRGRDAPPLRRRAPPPGLRPPGLPEGPASNPGGRLRCVSWRGATGAQPAAIIAEPVVQGQGGWAVFTTPAMCGP